MRILTACGFAVSVLLPAIAAAQHIVPQPSKLTAHSGGFTLTSSTTIVTDAASAAVAYQLANYLEPATGYRLRVVQTAKRPAGSISLRRDAALKRLGEEGYVLEVRAAGISIRASGDAGSFYAVQTIRQLLPA